MTQPKPKVLVVDDEQDVLTYLRTLLTDEGYEVETAADGMEAMAKQRSFHPDLITLDIVMPGMTGVNFYRDLKGDPSSARTPVVIITGLQQDFKQFISHRQGSPAPEGYLSKPFSRDELLEVLKSILKQRAAANG